MQPALIGVLRRILKFSHALSLVLLVLMLPGVCTAQQPGQTPPAKASLAASAQSEPSPAEQRIDAAHRQIQADPTKIQAYRELALAFERRARESSNPAFLTDAEQALARGLKIDPGDFQLRKARISLLLSRQQYIEAHAQAAEMNRSTPDDVMLYGYLAQADLALGNYAEAETSAQWMLNLLPNNVPGLMLAARLRALYGDADGALDLLNVAYTETTPTEPEELAWIANQIASVQIESGKLNLAGRSLQLARQLFPNYAPTLENLARLRLAQLRAPEAVLLFQQARRLDSDPSLLYDLGHAQDAASQSAESRVSYGEFEKLATKPGFSSDQTRLKLIALYSSDATHSPTALKLAREEVATRQDVFTLDALAWALNANRKFVEANAAEHKALSVGIQNALLFDHAGRIAQNLNHSQEAARYFALARLLNPALSPAPPSSSVPAALQGRDENSFAPIPIADPAALTVTPFKAPVPSPGEPTASFSSAAPAFAPVPVALLSPRPTDTDRIIHNAQAKVTRNSKDASALSTLGAAYFQRARETGDVGDYQLAEQSLTRSLDLVASDFAADAPLGTLAEVCMGEHRFAEALTFAHKALALGSGDVSPFAIVGDAYADMGEYEKAAAAYARLTPKEMTLSPRAAYARDSRLSYLQFISGNTPAAIALMNTAVAEGLEAQLPSENLAWLYYELGEYQTQAGDAGAADASYLAALRVHPGDYRAIAGLARLRANQGHFDEAVTLYRKAIAVVPMPLFIAELGDLEIRTGDQIDAKKQFQLVAYIGLLGHINQVLHNRDLALFYADHDMKLPEALALARKEFEVRHDVYSWDALAWALYKNGKLEEAAKSSAKALQFGTKDALLLYHAGIIAKKLGHQDQARANLQQALQINPHFHLLYAPAARQVLTALGTKTASNAGTAHVP